jgi:ADP-ribosylglycohydrolase
MACIAGSIAQAYYKKVPADIVRQVRQNLPDALLVVLDQFSQRYDCPY